MTRLKIGSFAANEIKLNGIEKVHAVLYQDDDGDLMLEDKKSVSGTFVNEIRIKRYRINTKDQIKLGKVAIDLLGHIKLKGDKLIGTRKFNDYSEEFLALKEVWENHKSRTLVFSETARKQQRMKQIFSSLGSLGLILGIAIPTLPSLLRVGLMGVGTAAAIYFVFVTTSNKSVSRKEEEKKGLHLQLLENYVCPKCKAPLPAQPFEALLLIKKHNVCQALWA